MVIATGVFLIVVNAIESRDGYAMQAIAPTTKM